MRICEKPGLLGEGEKSILSVGVRDPGGDMTKGFFSFSSPDTSSR